MNYKINHIPISKDKRPGTKMTPTSITIHSTANPKSTALNERNWLVSSSNDRTASWHIVVDDKEIIEAIPLNEIAYHAGKREGNNTSIGIEICESGDRAKTIQNTIELVAKMLHDRKWGVDKLKRHFDWSGKICPGILSKNNWEGWNAFKIQVERELVRLSNKNQNADINKSKIKLNLHGKDLEVEGIIEKGVNGDTNHIPIRFIEELGYKVGYKDSKVTIEYK